MNWFLKAKHWQLFILGFGIPMILQIGIMGYMISIFDIENPSATNPMPVFMIFFLLIMLLYTVINFGWLWSVAMKLKHKIPEGIHFKYGLFKAFVFIPFLFMLFILTFGLGANFIPDPAFFALLVPIQLFSMFCIFFTFNFVAKVIKTVELQKEVRFGEFVGEFFAIWFFMPIGVWILQPTINKLVKTENNEDII